MKTIWVTGASSGVGEQICEQLKGRDVQVVKLARRYGTLQKIDKGTYTCAMDLTDVHSIHSSVSQLYDANLQPDVLINNAGIGRFASSWDLSDDDVQTMFQLNMIGVIQLTNRVVPHMKKNKSGHIIQLASLAGKVATAKASVYAGTKHALLGYSNGLRLELKPYHVSVSVINPGPIDTPFLQAADKTGSYSDNMGAHLLQADQVAERVIQTLETKKREVNLPRALGILGKLYQLAPHFIEGIGKPFFYKK